ncbi:carbon-nitrogen hydrolase family protein [Ottowia sp.]|uniref:carbon-nitrogen hydrolase family protein n=1 Tax=Ottowia sp. TaxID=1898956 RepID=UPI00393E7BCA|nr:carbon-nitrogen hydrolase family protein [Pseudomonadota bacterium]
MKVAAIQMVSGTQVQANLDTAHVLLAEAAAAGAELAVLPEYFCVMGRRDTDKLALQEPLGDGPIQRWLADTARELRLWIVGGTLPLSCEPPDGLAPRRGSGSSQAGAAAPLADKCRNASLVFAPTGERVAHYDKIHLFRFDDGERRYDEAAVLVPGSQPVTFELPARDGHVWRVGLSVCYDLRFPELYRTYAAQGADLLLVPSAFTHVTGQAHWELLLRARAIENLSAVIAAAQGGLHENGRRTWGHSMVVDAWGQVLAEHAEGAGVALAELDWAALHQRRQQLPALSHRRLK